MSWQRNQRIAALATQLPIQRQRLTLQTAAVMQAVNSSVTSPRALVVAAGSGAVLGWCWFCRADATANGQASHNTTVVGRLLWQSLSAMLMAYLARSFA